MRIGAPLHHLDTHNNGTQTVYSFDYDVWVMLLPESLPPTALLFFLLLLTQTFRIEAPQMILPDQKISSSVGQDPSSPVLSFVQKNNGRLGIHGATHGGAHEHDDD